MSNTERYVLDTDTAQQASLVERQVLSLIASWLGFVRAAQRLTPEAVEEAVTVATSSRVGPYSFAGTQLAMLSSLPIVSAWEQFVEGVEFERDSEGRSVTPVWWLAERTGVILARHIVKTTEILMSTVEDEVINRAAGENQTLVTSRAVLMFRGLELLEKVSYLMPVIDGAMRGLQRLRKGGSGIDEWPEIEDYSPRISSYRRTLLIQLSVIVPDLVVPTHDYGVPDLFGQCYQVLFDATFQAILGGEDDHLSKTLFFGTFLSAEHARQRVGMDLQSESDRDRAIYLTEPTIGLMELSGCALLMQELRGTGIWDEVASTWSQLLEGEGGQMFLTTMIESLRFQHDLFMLTTGGTMRSQRLIMLRDMMIAEGVPQRDPWDRRLPSPDETSSPIVALFSPQRMPIGPTLEDLFVAEFLMAREGSATSRYPRHVVELRQQLEQERARRRGENV